nr:flagellar hook-associated protein FlgK [Sedimentibacter sp.]
MLRSTFAGFKTANSGLRTSQNLLDVVGQNISNVNTSGYTRQRLDINSVSLNTSNMKYSSNGVIIGQGVTTSGISQYRDSFLDLRYRREAAKTGDAGVQLDALNELESIFDETLTDGLDDQFSDLIEKLQALSSSPSDPVLEGVVKTSASLLCQMFNNYSNQINTIKEEQTSYLEDGAIVKVNQLMKNISDLNKQIKQDNISGNPSLELNDRRNSLIDELSSYLDIEVTLTPEGIGGGKTVDTLSIQLKGNGMDLINNDEYCEFEVTGAGSDHTGINLKKSIDANFAQDTDLTSSINNGQIGGYLKVLNGQGEFGETGSPDDRGIQFYEKMLDSLANKFAEVMNDANTKIDGTLAPLFESSVSGEDVNAGNIKISDDWKNTSKSYITNTKIETSTDNSGANDNILTMISLFKNNENFTAEYTDEFGVVTSKDLFTGTMQEYLAFTSTSLSLHVEDTKSTFDTYDETLYQIDYSRTSLSSVDLDEEGVNLLAYQKSYNAAARLMTTLDEMLNTLINTMAV